MVRKLVIAFTMVFVISLTFVTNPNSSIAQVKGEVPGNTLGWSPARPTPARGPPSRSRPSLVSSRYGPPFIDERPINHRRTFASLLDA